MRAENEGQGHLIAASAHLSPLQSSFYSQTYRVALAFPSSRGAAMDRKVEQRVCIKFCVRLGKSKTETLRMLREAFGAEALNRTAVFAWHSRFQAGRLSCEDDQRPGRPSTSKTGENVDRIARLVQEDPGLSIRGLADAVGISYGACQAILAENLSIVPRSEPNK